jgi:hypothetical protein
MELGIPLHRGIVREQSDVRSWWMINPGRALPAEFAQFRHFHTGDFHR